jgi:transcriptional regulator with XRE-family HTH domain
MSLGEVVRGWREAREWKQEELARRAGLTQSTVAYVEADKYANPTRKTLGGLAHAFGVTIDALLAAANGAAVEPGPPTPEALVIPPGLDPKWVADFLKYGHRLTAKQRQSLLQLARSLADEAAEQRAAKGEQEPGPQGPGYEPFTGGL